MPRTRLDALWAALPLDRWDARSDEELLARFLDERDQAAFEALLVRHTPGVRAACRGWLRSAADIDDATQATFLVLVQRASSIRERAALGRWLSGVATNVARRLQRQRSGFPLPDNLPGPAPAEYDDLHDLLATEVARLPEKFRLPVQLCYCAGLSTAEAARCLGWPKGTVLTRLAGARERLKKCLLRRGVAPAALGGMAVLVPPAVGKQWLGVTAQAALAILAGQSPAVAGVSTRTIALTEGVVRTMTWNRVKTLVFAAVLAMGGIGFGILHWASASDGPGKGAVSRTAEANARTQGNGPAAGEGDRDPERPKVALGGKDLEGRTGRRREAVIRLPIGAFFKEVDAPPYGSGRITWTYEDERVLGLIEGSVMGVEFELATEAEYSLSSNGTIYGLLTNVQLNHLRLPDGEVFAAVQPYVKLWSAVEPLVSEMTSDLPFSYRFRVHKDRLVISNFRMLLAGPNPLGKVGLLVAGSREYAPLAAFQAFATAIEGTYVIEDREKPANRRPFLKPRTRGDSKKSK
jgi:RNA polymerase sigma factor (sigma-70 family)